ncbi:MAG: metal ABC transporter ATP-binding protein [Acidimicrobiales bacterium]
MPIDDHVPDPSPDVIEADDVGYSYRDHAVLDGVSFRIAPGEFVALAGPNGSGKTTLLRLLLGLDTAARGRVRLLGSAPDELDDRWRVGYVPQRVVLPEALPATVAEVVAAGRLARRGWWRRPDRADRAAVDHAIESVALTNRRATRVHQLSGGQQQRVLIAKALVSEPEVLVLDEPVAGVDLASQKLFREALVHLVTNHGAAVLLVSHELGAVAGDLDRVLVLRHGRITFDGDPTALAATGVSLGIHDHDLPLWLEGLG